MQHEDHGGDEGCIPLGAPQCAEYNYSLPPREVPTPLAYGVGSSSFPEEDYSIPPPEIPAPPASGVGTDSFPEQNYSLPPREVPAPPAYGVGPSSFPKQEYPFPLTASTAQLSPTATSAEITNDFDARTFGEDPEDVNLYADDPSDSDDDDTTDAGSDDTSVAGGILCRWGFKEFEDISATCRAMMDYDFATECHPPISEYVIE